jgi:hypothetical protein
MADNLTTLSYSDLRENAAAIEREVQRRETMDQAAREEQFRAELDEVRAGTRAMQDEHIAYLTPREVETCVNRPTPEAGPVSSGGKRRYTTLRSTPVSQLAGETQRRARSGEAARVTDRHIKVGTHPLAAYQRARQGVRRRRRAS